MKPKDKEAFVRNREALVRQVEVQQVFEWLKKQRQLGNDQAQLFNRQDEDSIMQDPRRRTQTARMLDMIEKRPTESYNVFLDALEDLYPHLYLMIFEYKEETAEMEDYDERDDHWSVLQRTRKYLISEIDATNVLPYMLSKAAVSPKEASLVGKSSSSELRTEALLDLMETKTGDVYDHFLDAIGETYPHVYLVLKGDDQDDDF